VEYGPLKRSKEASIAVSLDSGNNIGFNVFSDTGTLAAYKKVGGATTTLTTAPYDASSMRWLRLRESEGRVYYEYSAAVGGPWTVLVSEPNPFALSRVMLHFDAGTWAAETAPGTVAFDNFRLE
jgi:hypothetical protein